jgi:hypothetical protein
MTRKKVNKNNETTKTINEPSESAHVSRIKPLVFISHDSRDGDLAEEFGNLLTDVSGGTLKNFRSSDRKGTAGIEFGAEWYQSIMTKLGDATDVVALLTQNSIDRPWILYEAGVAKGKLDTTVFGLALGIPLEKASTGPFGQFQNCSADEDQLTKLVMQLIGRHPEAAPRVETVRRQVKVFEENVGTLLKERSKSVSKEKTPESDTPVAKMFEEVKVMVKQLPDKIDSSLQQTRYRNTKTNRRFHPAMIDELLHMSGMGSDPIGIIIAASFIKDDVPWLYEMAVESYQAIRSKNTMFIRREIKRLERVFEFMKHTPFLLEMGIDTKEIHYFINEFPRLLSSILENEIENREKNQRLFFKESGLKETKETL